MQNIHLLRPEAIMDKVVEPYTLSVPPTSLKAFAGFIKGVGDLELCPQVVETVFRIEQDDEVQLRLTFEMAEELDQEHGEAMLNHADRAGDSLMVPSPDKGEGMSEEKPAKPANTSKIQGKPTTASRARGNK